MAITRLPLITLDMITRRLKKVRGLYGGVWVVGGVVTEGFTLRDIDIVITDRRDIPKLEKFLGPKLAPRAQFMHQKGKPPAPIMLEVTGKDTQNPISVGDRNKKFKWAGVEEKIPVKY